MRFRANDLLADAKLTAPLAAHDRDDCATAASGIAGGEVVRAGPATLPAPGGGLARTLPPAWGFSPAAAWTGLPLSLYRRRLFKDFEPVFAHPALKVPPRLQKHACHVAAGWASYPINPGSLSSGAILTTSSIMVLHRGHGKPLFETSVTLDTHAPELPAIASPLRMEPV